MAFIADLLIINLGVKGKDWKIGSKSRENMLEEAHALFVIVLYSTPLHDSMTVTHFPCPYS
jgi:hypothetical protein